MTDAAGPLARASRAPLAVAVAALCATGAGCPDPAAGATGVDLVVAFDDKLALDQVRLDFFVDGAPILDETTTPTPSEKLDPGGALFRILVDDSFAGETLAITVDGLAGGARKASGDTAVALVKGKRVAARVTLGAPLACGDGKIRAGLEACDDGGVDDGDGCSAACAIEPGFTCTGEPSSCTAEEGACGDGAVDDGEGCDDGDLAPGDGCDDGCAVEPGYTCTGAPSVCLPLCGNGVTDDGEGCDDDNLRDGDGCSLTCTVEEGFFCAGSPSACNPICGDGLVRADETCDDGGGAAGDGCDARCHTEPGFVCFDEPSQCNDTCGNRALDEGELCDDGNLVANDGCSPTCTVDPGFVCNNDAAPSLCAETCGNGVLDDFESCDDSNSLAGDGCSPTCLIEPGFSCPNEGDACVPVCGDGVVAGLEPCDDGNTAAGDGCDSVCEIEAGYACVGEPSHCAETCGDGSREPGELCDDGNTDAGDGCSPVCFVEPGFTCSGSPSACVASCGDGVVDTGEACDDDNTDAGDGCSPTCVVEAGFSCPAQGGACGPVCGDGLIRGGEACDDHGTAPGDGCSPTCTVEAGFICGGQPSSCAHGCLIGGVAIAEGSLDPTNPCRACRFALNPTAYSNAGDGTACSDGVFCNGAETCASGVCGAGAAPCGGDQPLCNEANASCACTGASCDDGAFCNGGEVCRADGTCGPGTPPLCTAPNGVCDETGNHCVQCVGDGDCTGDVNNPFCNLNHCVACPTCNACNAGDHDGGDGTCVPDGTCSAGFVRAFTDGDGDGVGAGALSADCFAQPLAAGLSATGTDCNDGDASIFQTQSLFFDDDLDGFTRGTAQNDCVGASLPATRKTTLAPPPHLGFEGGAVTAVNGLGSRSWSRTFGAQHIGHDTASVTISDTGQVSQQLRVSSYGLAIPASATIRGVRVHLLRRGSSSTRTIRDKTVTLLVNGAPSGNNKSDTATNWPTTLTDATYGGPTDTWGLSLTPAQVNASGFGVGVDVVCTSCSDEADAQVDVVWLEVFTDEGADCDDANAAVFTSVSTITDADGDGYVPSGANAGSACVGLAMPALLSQHSLGSDCFDGGFSARPGQTSFFSTNRGDGSFDYDCNATEERQDVTSDTGCQCNTFCSSSGSTTYTPTSNCGTQTDDDRCSGSCSSSTCALDTAASTTTRCR